MRQLIYRWIEAERHRQTTLYPPPGDLAGHVDLLAGELVDVVTLIDQGHSNMREHQDQLLHVAAVAVGALEHLGLLSEPTCLGESNWGVSARSARALRHRLGLDRGPDCGPLENPVS